ncbi:MAG: response regulator, partial [Desulfobacteraceae bacterium]
MMAYKILFIDDDRNVLEALTRELEGIFDFETAAGAEAGLMTLEKNGPFAVIVSDYFMPGMDGIELLSRARQTDPDCVRLMLSGHANLATAVNAVNKGNIFRLLTKPWDHDLLVQSLNAAIAQYRLVMVEKELLAKTIKLTESLNKERQNLQLTNRKLQETVENAHYLAKKATTSNVAKTEFLANMSHELRTPLSGIIGMLDLVLDTSLDEQQREYLGLAKYSANSLLSIVNDILDFARIEAGKLVMARAPFSLKNLAHATLGALKLKAESKKLKLEYAFSEKCPDRLMGDADRLRQILLNLLGNALKFTEQGGITLTIAELETENRLKLRFSVADTGIGIPQAKLKTIFDSFTQADGSHSRKFGGAGLGLSIS